MIKGVLPKDERTFTVPWQTLYSRSAHTRLDTQWSTQSEALAVHLAHMWERPKRRVTVNYPVCSVGLVWTWCTLFPCSDMSCHHATNTSTICQFTRHCRSSTQGCWLDDCHKRDNRIWILAMRSIGFPWAESDPSYHVNLQKDSFNLHFLMSTSHKVTGTWDLLEPADCVLAGSLLWKQKCCSNENKKFPSSPTKTRL